MISLTYIINISWNKYNFLGIFLWFYNNEVLSERKTIINDSIKKPKNSRLILLMGDNAGKILVTFY